MKEVPKLRKTYEKRVDLKPYQRLLRFIHDMTPVLAIEDVFRILPEAEAWSSRAWATHIRLLKQALARDQTQTLAELIPYFVVGWGRKSGRWTRELLDGRRYAYEPVQLRKRPPTIRGLCHLANDLRRTLDIMLQQGEEAAFDCIADEIDGRIMKTFHRVGPSGRARNSRVMEVAKDNDFRTYCFWLLLRLIDEAHGWRLTQCDQCHGYYLKTRRDPPGRPSRFCGEQCRRDWHNPRRPKKGNPQ
jgi:hypothetical protein